VGQLAGGLAHDFNNILTAVNGSAELLRHERDPQERQALLSEIVAAGDRGAALTRQLLSFARREVIQPRVLDLSAHVATLRRLLQRVAGDATSCDSSSHRTAGCARIGQIEQASSIWFPTHVMPCRTAEPALWPLSARSARPAHHACNSMSRMMARG
jgi:signal transduction histidine kinase